VSKPSHGDGRYMTLADAVCRRARTIRVHGSLENALDHGRHPRREHGHRARVTLGVSRRWASWFCELDTCGLDALRPEDVLQTNRGPLAICEACRLRLEAA
jgi:hypothetical protein